MRPIGPFLERRMRERDPVPPGRFPTGRQGQACAIVSCAVPIRTGQVSDVPCQVARRSKDHMLKFTGSGDDLEDDFADMCGLMGQGAAQILKAHVPSRQNNVVAQGGTLALDAMGKRCGKAAPEHAGPDHGAL